MLGGWSAARALTLPGAIAPRLALPMLLGIDGGCNDPRLRTATCPCCGAVGDFRRHGSYFRNLVLFDGESLLNVRALIERALCRACRHTHSLLPRLCLPRSPFSRPHRRLVQEKARGGAETVAAICAEADISERSFYRIVGKRADRRPTCAHGMRVPSEPTPHYPAITSRNREGKGFG